MRFLNGCNEMISEALRHLAAHPRPFGGEEPFNAEHLLQLADELDRSVRLDQAAPVYCLRKMSRDMYGMEPEVWENVGFTTNHSVAAAWYRSSGMYEHRDFCELEAFEVSKHPELRVY